MVRRVKDSSALAAGHAPGRSGGRVVTVPNLLSALRLLGVPVFVWLAATHHVGWAIVVLAGSGVTDFLDGWLARRLGQTSRVGEVLDPLADRLCILSTVVMLAVRDVVPVWLAVLLPLRDVFLWLLLPLLRSRGYSSLRVHLLGKAATLCLLYAFPLLLLAHWRPVSTQDHWALLPEVFGWALLIWGAALYWWTAVLYAAQVRRLFADRTAGEELAVPGGVPGGMSGGGRRG